jgi:hypothetical protein
MIQYGQVLVFHLGAFRGLLPSDLSLMGVGGPDGTPADATVISSLLRFKVASFGVGFSCDPSSILALRLAY